VVTPAFVTLDLSEDLFPGSRPGFAGRPFPILVFEGGFFNDSKWCGAGSVDFSTASSWVRPMETDICGRCRYREVPLVFFAVGADPVAGPLNFVRGEGGGSQPVASGRCAPTLHAFPADVKRKRLWTGLDKIARSRMSKYLP